MLGRGTLQQLPFLRRSAIPRGLEFEGQRLPWGLGFRFREGLRASAFGI